MHIYAVAHPGEEKWGDHADIGNHLSTATDSTCAVYSISITSPQLRGIVTNAADEVTYLREKIKTPQRLQYISPSLLPFLLLGIAQ